jgi:hypothetical protein
VKDNVGEMKVSTVSVDTVTSRREWESGRVCVCESDERNR